MKYTFNISIETDERTGEIVAVYIKIRDGKVAETKDVHDGVAYADYDRKGELLGGELLAPCQVSVLSKLTKDLTVRKFLKKSIPRGMALAV